MPVEGGWRLAAQEAFDEVAHAAVHAAYQAHLAGALYRQLGPTQTSTEEREDPFMLAYEEGQRLESWLVGHAARNGDESPLDIVVRTLRATADALAYVDRDTVG